MEQEFKEGTNPITKFVSDTGGMFEGIFKPKK
jgi:hypothetical protein